jgi:hypothetical protein
MAAPGPPARRCIRRVYLSLSLLQPSARSHTPGSTLLRDGVEEALKLLEGRWKLVILFHLFGAGVLRFFDLESLERDGFSFVCSLSC